MAESFNRASVDLSTNTITDVYQAPNNAAADRAILLSCMVANVDGADSCDVTIAITDSSDTEIAKLASTIAVPADSTLEIIANKVILKQGEKIRATAGTASDLHVTVSALEIT